MRKSFTAAIRGLESLDEAKLYCRGMKNREGNTFGIVIVENRKYMYCWKQCNSRCRCKTAACKKGYHTFIAVLTTRMLLLSFFLLFQFLRHLAFAVAMQLRTGFINTFLYRSPYSHNNQNNEGTAQHLCHKRQQQESSTTLFQDHTFVWTKVTQLKTKQVT